MAITLPKLQISIPIVDGKGQPTSMFHRYFNVEFAKGIEQALTTIADQNTQIIANQAAIAAQQAMIIDILNGDQAFNMLNVNGDTVAALGSAAPLNVGTTAGTVAAGNDTRITGAAQKSANLGDLANAGTARSNLGLGNSATRNVGTTAGTVAAGDDSRIVNAQPKGPFTAGPDAVLIGYITVLDSGGAPQKVGVIA